MKRCVESKGICYDCRLLDMRELAGGRVVFWCAVKSRPLPDSYIWRRACRRFKPASKQGT